MKTVGVTNYTNQSPLEHFGWKKCLSSTPLKDKNVFIKCAQKGVVHLQCMINHNAKF